MGASPSEPDTREDIETALARGDGAAARMATVRLLRPLAAAGDEQADLIIRVLEAGAFAPDALAAAADRLAALVRAQDAQIRALRDMVEDSL